MFLGSATAISPRKLGCKPTAEIYGHAESMRYQFVKVGILATTTSTAGASTEADITPYGSAA